jgi:regulator of protease activity HflC (stomatin/prohibitin superfamily)
MLSIVRSHSARPAVSRIFKRGLARSSTWLESDKNHPGTKNVPFDINNYPPSKPNTVLNICPQGYTMVVETLGKFSDVKSAGWFLAVPFLQQIKYVVDDRELVIDVYKQYAHTLDNVQIGIAAQLYLQIVNVEKSCYRVKQPLVAVVAQVQSAMRASVGKYDLDHLLKDRNKISADVRLALCGSVETWGIQVNNAEITELTPDQNIARAMDLQATAERERRQTEKNADAKKRAMELESEGYRLKLINESEGYRLKLINESRGRAESLSIETEAQARAITTLAETGVSIDNVLRYQITSRYLDGLNKLALGGQHTTFFMNKDMSDMKAMTGNVLDLLNKPKDVKV